MRTITLLSTFFAVVLSACGGGGGDAEPSNTSNQYEVYAGNANREVVLDGANTQFAVRKSDRKLVHLSSNQALEGLSITANGDVNRNNLKVGVILLAAGTDGRTIATLACSGPAPDFGAMTISITNSSWAYRCASNTGNPIPPTTPPTDSGNGAAQVRSNCVRLEYQSSLGWQVRNSCQDSVIVAFCFINPEAGSGQASSRCADNNYGSSGVMRPASLSSIPSPGNVAGKEYSYQYLACAVTADRDYFPTMSNQGQTGFCR